jgi:hypothetical protein
MDTAALIFMQSKAVKTAWQTKGCLSRVILSCFPLHHQKSKILDADFDH